MATVEQLVIELIARTENAEREIEAVKKRLEETKAESKEAKRGLDEVSKASEATGRSGERGRRGVQKLGDELEKTGRKARSTASLVDKVQRRLARGWVRAITTYAAGFMAAGAVIGFIKDSISGVLEGATAIGKVAEVTGQTRTEIKALGSAFEALGVSQQSAYKYLQDFNIGKYDQAVAQVGVSTQSGGERRKGEDVLLELGQKAVSDSGGDKALAESRLQAIGIEAEVAKAAVNATQELIDAKRADGVATEEQIQKAEEASKRYTEFASRLGDVKDAFGYALLPIIEDVISGIEWLMDVVSSIGRGFEEASGGLSLFQTAIEILTAPLNILIEFVGALLEGLGGLEAWTSTGGKVVYGFFYLLQEVWNLVIIAANGVIVAIEGVINAVGRLKYALQDPFGTGGGYQEVKLGHISEIGLGTRNGGRAAWNTAGAGARRGAVRGTWGMPGTGGSGRGGRRGGRGGGRSSSAGKEEPIYRSTYQGTADPKRLGMQGAKGRIAEDPVQLASREAKRHGGYSAGARQVATASAQTFNFNNSIVVNAQGNPNARDIANRTGEAVSLVSRRQAGAMA